MAGWPKAGFGLPGVRPATGAGTASSGYPLGKRRSIVDYRRTNEILGTTREPPLSKAVTNQRRHRAKPDRSQGRGSSKEPGNALLDHGRARSKALPGHFAL